MHGALLIALLVALADPPPGDSNGAYPWGGGWVGHAERNVRIPGGGGQGSSQGGGGAWSDCYTFRGANGQTYLQCDNGPNGQNNLFEGVVPGEPGAPAITPEMLLDEALRLLVPPPPQVVTAPPRGRDGLVGLRHFYWAEPGQWRSISKRASAGPVWAEVTATPTTLTISPGGGQKSVTCRGPGTPYDAKKSPDAQQTACTTLFTRSSAGLPGEQYKVTVSVQWAASWTGSGGAGGALPPITTSATVPVRVAEGQALIQQRSS